ncbi:MAG: Gfo/Idh/MocA family protein [Thermomicrobiales bacterium]
MNSINVGIIGCGNVSLSALVPGVLATDGLTLAAVADPTPDRLANVAELAGLSPDQTFADWTQIVEDPAINAVIVATPQQFRPEISIAAANSGKHLLCEKPLAIAPLDAHRMVDAARLNRVVMATVHNYTYFPVYRALKEIIDNGEIGHIETATLNFLSVDDRPGNNAYRPRWRHDARESGGGVLMDMLHAVYLADWLMGNFSTSVSAFVDRRRDNDGDVEDYALVRYGYPSGQAMINMAWGDGPGGIELMGTEGRAILINQDYGTHPFVDPERIFVFSAAGKREVIPSASFKEGHRLAIANFRDALRGEAVPAASGADGARVLEAVVGAYKAGATGEKVMLPLEPDDPVFQFGAIGLRELNLPLDSPVRQRGMFGVGTPATMR